MQCYHPVSFPVRERNFHLSVMLAASRTESQAGVHGRLVLLSLVEKQEILECRELQYSVFIPY